MSGDDAPGAGDPAPGRSPHPEATRPPPPGPADLARIRAALGTGLLFMVVGGIVFLLAGFGFTALAGTSCFEGLCAYVPFLWFAPLGMVAGFVLGAKLGGRRAARRRPARSS